MNSSRVNLKVANYRLKHYQHLGADAFHFTYCVRERDLFRVRATIGTGVVCM